MSKENEQKKDPKESIEVNSQDQIDFNELFPNEFMTIHADLTDIYQFFSRGGFNAENDEEFEKIDEQLLDHYIQEHTDFENWQEMLGMAANEFISRKFDF